MPLSHWLRQATTCVAMAMTASAFAADVPPGQYAYTDGGSAHGTLTVKGSAFTIDTIGVNCHTCTAEGVIKGKTGLVKDSQCRIAFSRSGDTLNLDVEATVEACRDSCGMRASFDGEYRLPPPACTDRQRTARVSLSHRQYAAKNYDAARGTLTALIGECKPFMHWIEIDKARSDLAITEFHRGDRAQCLAALSDTVAVRMTRDDSISLPPCDKDNYDPTGKAIRHNLALCQGMPQR